MTKIGDENSPFGFHTWDRHLNWLEPVIRGWETVIKYSCNRDPKDPFYYYNERANISLLAGGAWEAGFLALEEYSAEKRKVQNPQEIGWGRTDLYICQKSRRNKDAIFEAKQTWIRPDTKIETIIGKRKTNGTHQTPGTGLMGAYWDAKKNLDISRVGLCFYPLEINADEYDAIEVKSKIREIISLFINHKQSMKRLKADAVAWCFPPEMSREKTEWKTRGKRYSFFYPGIIIAMRNAG